MVYGMIINLGNEGYSWLAHLSIDIMKIYKIIYEWEITKVIAILKQGSRHISL